MQQLILDVQHTARSFGNDVQASIEKAIEGVDARLDVCPQALAIPTQGPLDSFNSRAYPACYVEWWFGDGAPALERDRPMLFEQVARRPRGRRTVSAPRGWPRTAAGSRR